MTNPFSGDYAGVAYDTDQFVLSSTAVPVTTGGAVLTDAGSGDKCCAVIVSTSKALRYTIDGVTTPTALVGMPVPDDATFIVVGFANVAALQLIRQVADSTIDVTFLRS